MQNAGSPPSNLVHSDAAHFFGPSASAVPASLSIDEVCGEAPGIAAGKEDVKNDPGLNCLLGFVESIYHSDELPVQRTDHT